MPKSPDAFRTISEVADWLGIQAHVLRFWESKFAQVKPIKRAGGRRYYRPNDMLLLGGIRQLLHEDGLTIKGVQKILREEGVGHVASLSQPLDEVTQTQLDDTVVSEAPMIEEAEPEGAVVLNFEPPQEVSEATSSEPEPQEVPETDATEPELPDAQEVDAPELALVEASEAATEESPEPAFEEAKQIEAVEPAPQEAPTNTVEPPAEEASEPTIEATDDETFEPEIEPQEDATPAVDDVAAAPEPVETESVEAEPAAAASDLPAFLQRPMAEPAETTDSTPSVEAAPVEEPPAPKPRVIDVPLPTSLEDIPAAPALLTSVYRARHLSTDQARQIEPLLAKLTILRDSMAGRRPGGMQSGPDA